MEAHKDAEHGEGQGGHPHQRGECEPLTDAESDAAEGVPNDLDEHEDR